MRTLLRCRQSENEDTSSVPSRRREHFFSADRDIRTLLQCRQGHKDTYPAPKEHAGLTGDQPHEWCPSFRPEANQPVGPVHLPGLVLAAADPPPFAAAGAAAGAVPYDAPGYLGRPCEDDPASHEDGEGKRGEEGEDVPGSGMPPPVTRSHSQHNFSIRVAVAVLPRRPGRGHQRDTSQRRDPSVDREHTTGPSVRYTVSFNIIRWIFASAAFFAFFTLPSPGPRRSPLFRSGFLPLEPEAAAG